jgi:hypothetical protein
VAEEIERVVVVVGVDDARGMLGGLLHRRYALTSYGRQLEDPNWRRGTFFGTFVDGRVVTAEVRAAEWRQRFGSRIREEFAQAADEVLGAFVSALDEAGVNTSPGELRRVPVTIDFTAAALAEIQAEADQTTRRAAEGAARRRPRRRFASVALLLLGAVALIIRRAHRS